MISTTLVFKIVIVLILIAILISLGSALFFLVRDRGESARSVKSLTFRIALSVSLFILLFVGYLFGLIRPHGIVPPPPQEIQGSP